MHSRKLRIIRLFAVQALIFIFTLFWTTSFARAGTAVVTYHNDNFRTGWNSNETILSPGTVGGSSFGLLAQVPLDEQVDAQPLYLSGVQIAGATHNVVYVATESDTLYAIDADTGAVILSQNFGTPVPYTALPAQCINNSDVVGINSTPVIDPVAGIIYFIAYSVEDDVLLYRLHAVSTTTLNDVIPSVVVSATATLSNGETFPFNAYYERQRPALLLSQGNVYAGFGSFCDAAPQLSRGWVLGWNVATLASLPANKLTNTRSSSRYDWFLTSVWMSGYGLAADTAGNVYFATGNTDYSGTSFSPTENLSQTIIKMSPDLSTIEGFFTPSNHNALDTSDSDLGSGGVMLIPPLATTSPNMAVAAGKGGTLYLLNTDAFSTSNPVSEILGHYPVQPCWCGQSFFVGGDGIPRVATSIGDTVGLREIRPGAAPILYDDHETPALGSGPDPGFFTAISSNGVVKNSAVIWAVTRAASDDSTNTLTLKAFTANANLPQIFSGAAGTWPYAFEANSNIVPLVADGHVYVASYKQMSIFGLAPKTPGKTSAAPLAAAAPAEQALASGHAFFGNVQSATRTRLTVRLRNERILNVDVPSAISPLDPAASTPGASILARGNSFTGAGHLTATSVLRVKPMPDKWPADY